MDFPEGARVINASIDLAVHGRDPQTRPPVEAYLRVIDRPVLRLVSVDLGAEVELTEIDEVFDFAKDYLGLLKAAVIASGLVPPAMEGCHRSIAELLRTLTGQTGKGLELVSQVNDIPKGSRLAVSTNLLGCLISALMRATGQVARIEGGLEEPERRLVAARAILGEWLGGSGGGWQDSGGVWPGIKLIHGTVATESDPEHGISRGRLLPDHQILRHDRISPETRQKLQDSLILVHGGMAPERRPNSRDGYRKIPFAERSRMVRSATRNGVARRDARRIGRRGSETGWRTHDREFYRPSTNDYSMVHQSVYRLADRSLTCKVRRSVLGILDARWNERRRNGFYL